MKKDKNFIFLLLIGLSFLVIGIFLTFTNYKESSKKDTGKESQPLSVKPAFSLKIDTGNLMLQNTDLKDIEFIDLDLSKESFIKSADISIKNKYIFNYSKELSTSSNSDTSISFYSINLDLNVEIVNSSISNYYNNVLKNTFDIQKENIKQEYFASEIMKNNGIEVMYAKTCSFQDNHYLETFYFIIKESDNSSVLFTLRFKDCKVSDESLSKFVNSIKIDKNNAKYLYSTYSNDKKLLKVSLSQICVNKNTSNTVKLTLPTSLFKEEERSYNSNYITTFSINGSEESSIIITSNCNYYSGLLENIGSNAKKTYPKLENYKLENKEINNIKFQILSFKYFLNNIECQKVFIVGINKDIGYYMVEITSLDKISDDVIDNLTNIKFR